MTLTMITQQLHQSHEIQHSLSRWQHDDDTFIVPREHESSTTGYQLYISDSNFKTQYHNGFKTKN